MSRTIKTDQFCREVSDDRPRGSPGGWDEGSDQYCMCHKMLPSDNPQNRTNANAMVTLKMYGCEYFYRMFDKHGDCDHDHTVVDFQQIQCRSCPEDPLPSWSSSSWILFKW